jgi:hypothetical protein
MNQARAVKMHVERLVAACRSGHPPDDLTQAWLETASAKLRLALSRVGLIAAAPAVSVDELCGSFIEFRNDVTESTRQTYRRAKNLLIRYFGASKRIDELTAGDATEWRHFMLSEAISENTTRKMSSIAKQFFSHALDKELVRQNVFAGLPVAVTENRERERFIGREVISDALKHCPDAEWRLILVMARYAGFRTPSEQYALRWTDIDWKQERIRVDSPKTGLREFPLFPELREPLLDCLDVTPDTSGFVIQKHRLASSNLRTQFLRILKRAGLEPWPKLFQNLRASRQTELTDEFPPQVVCSWIGNSVAVANRHYLQVTDEHFAKAVQNPVQQMAESSGTEMHRTDGHKAKRLVFPSNSPRCSHMQPGRLGDEGLEHDAETPCFQDSTEAGGAESGAMDDGLRMIVAAWPRIPQFMQARILRVIGEVNSSCDVPDSASESRQSAEHGKNPQTEPRPKRQ